MGWWVLSFTETLFWLHIAYNQQHIDHPHLALWCQFQKVYWWSSSYNDTKSCTSFWIWYKCPWDLLAVSSVFAISNAPIWVFQWPITMISNIHLTNALKNVIGRKFGHFSKHYDVIKWKYFPRYWPFVRGIHRSPVNSPHKGQWRGASMFPLICAWINRWVNNREAGDLRRHHAHYDVNIMGPMDSGSKELSTLPLLS